MSKKPIGLRQFVVGCGGLIFLVLISGNLLFQAIAKSWDDQLATLIATDNSISAPGDGSHAVPVDPETALNIGQTSTIFGINITLDRAYFLKSAGNVSGSREYWVIEFTGKSSADEIQYGINPRVEAQIQYFEGNSYIWTLNQFEQQQCDDGNLANGFEPGDSFHCRFIYLVPSDEQNLYWIYARTDYDADGILEERFAVFQIR